MNDRRLRILVVSHHALPHVGGLENAVDLEIRGLAAAGHIVTLLTSDLGGAGREPIYPANVTTIRIAAWHWLERCFGIPYPLFSPALFPSLIRLIAMHDLVHAHGFMFMNTALTVWLAKALNRPCILSDHGGIQQFGSKLVTFLARIGGECVGRLSSLLATRIVTYNSRVQRQLNHLGRRHDAEFLPNPVDRQLFPRPTAAQRAAARQALGWDAARPKVLFVGRLIAAKGVPLLLASIDSDYDLVFCGPGDTSILGSLPRPGIEYLSPRPQAELVNVYHAADMLVLPADVREGFPLVVQEALVSGLPAVLGYDPGFEPYRILPGLTFTERTPKAVKSAIRTALTSAGRAAVENNSAALDEFFPALPIWVERLLQG
jgi:glycosyltransferase involved in cell wall biosynthesis